MGTWALPNTTEKAKQLQEMFLKPIYITEEMKNKLYYLYGDDELWDEIGERKYDYGTKYDIRFLIACFIDGLIKYYEENPNAFMYNLIRMLSRF